MKFLLYLPISFLILIYGFLTYRTNTNKKTIIAFGLLMISSLLLTVVYVLEIPIPSPLELITFVFKPVSNFLFSLF